jgi:integrase
MPRIKLTQLACDRLKPPTDVQNITYWDLQLPGFGLRVSARGRKTWIAMYRVNRHEIMETLGTMAVMPNVAQARDAARASMLQARQGINPVEQRRSNDAAQAAAAAVAQFTFGRLVERYMKEHAERNTRQSTARETRRLLNRAVAVWGERPANSISKSDIRALRDDIAERRLRKQTGASGGAAIESNSVLGSLKTMFKWAVREDLLSADPTDGVQRLVKEKARDRVLDADEIKLFWQGTEQLRWPFGPLFQLLLATAQRRSEVGGMCWSEIDIERSQWTIPAQRCKNNKEHIVHLSPLAMRIINALPRLQGELIFSINGGSSVSGYSSAKATVDQFMRAQRDDLAGWTLHDLRRSAATKMAEELRILPHVVDRVLNHTSGAISGVAAIYNRSAYLDERKVALDAWGRWLAALVHGGPPSNVIAIRVS